MLQKAYDLMLQHFDTLRKTHVDKNFTKNQRAKGKQLKN